MTKTVAAHKINLKFRVKVQFDGPICYFLNLCLIIYYFSQGFHIQQLFYAQVAIKWSKLQIEVSKYNLEICIRGCLSHFYLLYLVYQCNIQGFRLIFQKYLSKKFMTPSRIIVNNPYKKDNNILVLMKNSSSRTWV